MDVWGSIGRFRQGRWIVRALALVLLVIVLAVADRSGRSILAERRDVTAEARWIWDEPAPEGRDRLDVPADPAAFYALDEFDLEEAVVEAQVQIMADEEYLLWVNGVFLGGGSYREVDRGSVDVYEVGEILRPGKNWVVAEVRSRRPVGGLLCRVRSGDETLSATGESWRIEARFVGAELGKEMTGLAEPPHLWGSPPVGRWGVLDRERVIGLPATRFVSPPIQAKTWSRRDVDEWKPVRRLQRRNRSRGRWVTFDWGATVEGYLNIRRIVTGPESEPARALILLGEEPPDAREQARGESPADLLALFVPGSPGWTSPEPVRFRYVTVLGLDGVAAAEVYELTAAATAPVLATPEGVAGLQAARLRTSVENEVRRELENVLGVAAR